MNTSSLGRTLVTAGLCVGIISAISTGLANAAEPTYRDLVRKYAQVNPAKIPGVATGQEVIALEYTVLLRDRDGNESPLDAATHQFNLGDQIRVQITPLNNVYIYIFHEGASKRKYCLLPEGTEQAPQAQASQMMTLPSNGFFEFSPPPGDEKLIVVATKQPSGNLTALQSAVFKKPDEELSEVERKERDQIYAAGDTTLNSMPERPITRYRGLLNESTYRDVADKAQQGHTSVLAEEPPTGPEKSTLAISAGDKGAGPLEMYIEIPLRSR